MKGLEIRGDVPAKRRDELNDRERQLVRELYSPLRKFAAVVGPQELDPDDLVQEAFVRVLRRGSMSDLDAPLAYLRRTILNLASNHRRRLGRRRRAMGRLAGPDENRSFPSYPSDLADLFALPPGDRALLYLADVENYPFAEIARMLGGSESAVRKRASRARGRLRQALREEAR